MKNSTTGTKTQTQCRRCGRCCRKGGPGLHLEDQELVDSGKIQLKQLLTIRQGEPAFDNITDTIAPAVTDILVLKSTHENRTDCVFYEAKHKRCTIYDHRPSECSALKCWDTSEIEKIYNCRRLTRRHLLSNVEGLWQLVQDHQEQCDYAYIAELAARVRQSQKDIAAEQKLLELIRYDSHLRQITLDRSNLDAQILDFLFGRPLTFTIRMFQLKFTQTGKGMTLESIGNVENQVCYRRDGF